MTTFYPVSFPSDSYKATCETNDESSFPQFTRPPPELRIRIAHFGMDEYTMHIEQRPGPRRRRSALEQLEDLDELRRLRLTASARANPMVGILSRVSRTMHEETRTAANTWIPYGGGMRGHGEAGSAMAIYLWLAKSLLRHLWAPGEDRYECVQIVMPRWMVLLRRSRNQDMFKQVTREALRDLVGMWRTGRVVRGT